MLSSCVFGRLSALWRRWCTISTTLLSVAKSALRRFWLFAVCEGWHFAVVRRCSALVAKVAWSGALFAAVCQLERIRSCSAGNRAIGGSSVIGECAGICSVYNQLAVVHLVAVINNIGNRFLCLHAHQDVAVCITDSDEVAGIG